MKIDVLRRPALTRMLRQMRLRRTRVLRAAGRAPAWTPVALRWARRAAPPRDGPAARVPGVQAGPILQLHRHVHPAAFSAALRDRRTTREVRMRQVHATISTILLRTQDRMAATVERHRPRKLHATGRAGASQVRLAPAAELRFGALVRNVRVPARRLPAPVLLPPPEPSSRRPGRAARDRSVGMRPASAPPALRSPMPAPQALRWAGSTLYGQGAAVQRDLRVRKQHRVTRTLSWSKRAQSARELPARTRAPAAAGRPVDAIRHAGPAAAAPARLPVELVWLAGPPSSAAQNQPAGSETRYAGAAPAARSVGQAGATPAAPGQAADRGEVRATALDPALANRLADEVIRRIDRRARIERERRGS